MRKGSGDGRYDGPADARGGRGHHALRGVGVLPRNEAPVQAAHQSLRHLIAKADWSDAAMSAATRAEVLPAIQQHGPIQTCIAHELTRTMPRCPCCQSLTQRRILTMEQC